MDDTLHCDLETRSICDLKKFGADIYSRHPSTDAWCMSFAFNEEPIETWFNPAICPMSEADKIINRQKLQRVFEHVRQRKKVVAHNAVFEHLIWTNCLRKKYGWPALQVTQLSCTMARAHAMSLPPALANLAPALGIASHKDMAGRALMMKMAKARLINDDGSIVWWDEADKIQRLGLYCAQDVNVERQCDKKLVPLSAPEQQVWIMDQRINWRGIGVDREAITAVQPIIERVKRKLDGQIKDLTKGHVRTVTEASKILLWANDQGVDIESLRKNEMADWLAMPDLPPEVRAVLEIRGDGAKTSVAKLDTMMTMSMFDGRLRGMFQYHGANTGRWAARAVQLHNMPRPPKELEDPRLQDEIISMITRGEMNEDFIEEWYGPFMRVLSACVRGYLVAADGHHFIGADLVNIEGVALAWLADEQWKIDAFYDFFGGTGHDLYLLSAGRIYNVAPEKAGPHRQIGKVSELALGFGGGVGAFQSMAVNYGVKVGEAQAEEIKNAWRDANPNIKNYWYEVNDAAMNAVKAPGAMFKAGPAGRQVAFRVAGSFLWLMLPTGRVLCYPYPQLDMVMKPWGEEQLSITFMGIDGRPKSPTQGKWTRLSTYGGSLVENITQAVARDVLVNGMIELDKRQYPLVLHVHDEAVAECRDGFGSVEEVEAVMSAVPAWATGMPLKAKGFMGRRYRK